MKAWMLALAAAACAAFSVCAAPPAHAPSVLASETRLAARITLRAPMITLEKALAQVGKQCDVELRADPDVRGDTVVVLVRDRPARDTLEQLALALDYSWRSAKGKDGRRGYVLFQGEAARQREHELKAHHRIAAAGEIDRGLTLLRQHIQKYPRPHTREAAQDQRDLQQRINALPIGAERFAAEEELFAAGDAETSEGRGLLAAWDALPRPLQERVILGERIVMAAHRPDTVPMPPEVLAALRLMREGMAARQIAPTPPAQTDDEAVDFTTAFNFGVLQLQIRARSLGSPMGTPALLIPHIAMTPSRAMFGPPLLDDAPGTLTAEQPDALHAIQSEFASADRRDVPDEPWTYSGGAALPELLETLDREKLPVACVGDAYFRALRPPSRRTGTATDADLSGFAARNYLNGRGRVRPLDEILRDWAELGNSNITVTAEGWVRLRSTVYFDDRDGAVDPDLVRDLFKPLVAEQRPYTPETAVDAAAKLTRAQVSTLSGPYLAFLTGTLAYVQGAADLAGPWAEWRLIGALSDAHRQELFAGKALPYARLASSERDAIRVYLGEVSSRPATPPLDLELGPGDLESLAIRLDPALHRYTRSFEVRLAGQERPLYARGVAAAGASAPTVPTK